MRAQGSKRPREDAPRSRFKVRIRHSARHPVEVRDDPPAAVFIEGIWRRGCIVCDFSHILGEIEGAEPEWVRWLHVCLRLECELTNAVEGSVGLRPLRTVPCDCQDRINLWRNGFQPLAAELEGADRPRGSFGRCQRTVKLPTG